MLREFWEKHADAKAALQTGYEDALRAAWRNPIELKHYEQEHYDLPPPDPIAALEYFMESRGWTRKDLEPYIGSRGRVAEIPSRKRPLTLAMIRKLEQATQIPVAILIQPYELAQDDNGAAAPRLPSMAQRTTVR